MFGWNCSLHDGLGVDVPGSIAKHAASLKSFHEGGGILLVDRHIARDASSDPPSSKNVYIRLWGLMAEAFSEGQYLSCHSILVLLRVVVSDKKNPFIDFGVVFFPSYHLQTRNTGLSGTRASALMTVCHGLCEKCHRGG